MSFKEHINYLLKKYQDYHFEEIEREKLYKKETSIENYDNFFKVSNFAKT